MSSLTISHLARHASVHTTRDARDSGDGIWIFLSPGWVTGNGAACIHEATIADAVHAHRHVTYQPGAWAQRYAWAYPEQVGQLPAG